MFESLYGSKIGTYDGSDIVPPEGSTKVTAISKLEGLLLGDLLGSIYGIELGKNVVYELGLFDGKVLVRTLGDLVGVYLED